MKDYKDRRDGADDSSVHAALSGALVALLVLTILALLTLGGLLIWRIVDTIPTPPAVTDPVTPPVSDDPAVTSGTAPTTDAPQSGTPTSSAPTTTVTPTTSAPATTVKPNTEPGIPSSPVILPETADAGNAYLKKIVFLGDSTTYHMHHYTDLDDAQVWTPVSGTLDLNDITAKKIAYPESGKKYTEWAEVGIADALRRRQPQILVVTLGVNFSAAASGWDDAKIENYFKQQIRNIVNMVKDNSPSTKLIFQSIYPTIDSRVAPSLKNSEIDKRNRWILDVCEETGTPMLWSIEALRDSTGNMVESYNAYHGDGIHMYNPGYDVVLKYVRTHAVQ